MNLDRRLLHQIRYIKFFLALAVAAGFAVGLATVLQARQLSHIIAGVFLGDQSLSGVMPWLWGLLGILFTRAALTYLAEIASSSAAQRVKQHLRGLLARHLFELGPAYAQGERSGELVNTVTQGVEALDAYFSQYLPQLALAGLLPLAFLVIVFPLDPLSGIVLLLTGPLIPIFMFLIGNASEALTQRRWKTLSRMSAYFLDILQGLVTLKALGRSREQSDRVASVSEQYRLATMRVLRVTFLSALVLELLSTMGTAIIAVEIGLRLLYNHIEFEQAFFILLLAPDFYLPLRSLGLRFHASMTGVSAARRIFEVLEQPVKNNLPAASAPTVSLREPFTLEFRGVSYTYPGRDRAALKDVSLQMHSGQVVALVGSSGAGKSTLAALLMRFIQPDQGEMIFNGISMAEIPIDPWREQIAWVPQQPYLFHGSLAENLRIALQDAPEVKLREACAQAGLLDWVETLPKGLDTPLGEGGTQISGGQAQRLAVARAFLRDAPFLVLDEPTAHLDVAQEQMLRDSTRRLCANRTVLVIAHRLPTVIHADQILVMEAGQVVEQGRHTDLMAYGGAYTRLLSAYQAGLT